MALLFSVFHTQTTRPTHAQPRPLLLKKARFGRGAVGSSCCYAMHRLTTHSRWPGPAPGGIATRASDSSSSRSPRLTRPGCQLATHPRRREAAGRSVDPPCSVPPLRRRVGGRRFFEPDSKQASVFPRRPALMPALVFRIGAATHTHVAIQTFHTLQLRTGLEDEIWGCGFFGFSTLGSRTDFRRPVFRERQLPG